MQLNAHGDSCEDNIAQSIGYCCIFDGWLECLNLNSCQHLQFSLDQTWQWHHHYVFFRCRKPPPRRQYLSADWGPLGPHHLEVKVKTSQISQQKLWCCNIGVGDTVRFLFRVCLHKHLSVPICLMRGRREKMESWWWARSIFDLSVRPSYTSISHVSSRHGGSDQVITGRLILIYFDLN